MGYSTDFYGQFTLNTPLDQETYDLLLGLSQTRRLARKTDQYGVEGEFYIGGNFNSPTGDPPDALPLLHDQNTPPKTQPGLWCQWVPTEDRLNIERDEGEKFYNYVEWITYLIKAILAPRGYLLNGE